MPYKRSGKTIYHRKGGKWKVKQQCDSVESAKKALNLLRGIEHGWTPTNARKEDTQAGMLVRLKRGAR